MRAKTTELIRLELGISYYRGNDWKKWFDSNARGKGSSRDPKGEKAKDNGVVTAVIEQVGLDGELHVSKVLLNSNSNIYTTPPSNGKGGKETS